MLNNHTFFDKLRNGDEKAAKQLYEMLYPWVITFVIRNAGTKEDGKDLMSLSMVTFFKLLLNPDFRIIGKGDESNVEKYLKGICYNLWMKELAARNKRSIVQKINSEFLDNIPYQLYEETEEEKQKRKVLIKYIYQWLSENKKYYNVIYLKVFEDFSHKEIAALLDMNYDLVRQDYSRGIKHLKKYLEKVTIKHL